MLRRICNTLNSNTLLPFSVDLIRDAVISGIIAWYFKLIWNTKMLKIQMKSSVPSILIFSQAAYIYYNLRTFLEQYVEHLFYLDYFLWCPSMLSVVSLHWRAFAIWYPSYPNCPNPFEPGYISKCSREESGNKQNYLSFVIVSSTISLL